MSAGAGQADALEIINNGNARRYLPKCGYAWAIGVIIILENPRNITIGFVPG